MRKPFDNDFLGNPFGEALDVSSATPPRLTYDLVKTLGKMSNQIGISRETLLSESDDEDN